MRDEIMGAQEEAHRLHELRQGAVSELSRLRYAEEELEQVETQMQDTHHPHYSVARLKDLPSVIFYIVIFNICHLFRSAEH